MLLSFNPFIPIASQEVAGSGMDRAFSAQPASFPAALLLVCPWLPPSSLKANFENHHSLLLLPLVFPAALQDEMYPDVEGLSRLQ